MRIAAYCRVSTDKADQLNSLEAQKRFFMEYARRTGDELVELYADEGLSGTKTRNRRAFLRMMADAEAGRFAQLVVKDISRLARNTVDLLQSVRRLKALGIETQFLTAGMTCMGSSEFVLTLFGALAQEESANTSKRVKFGKRLNAEKGRVPNLVYGYDKTAGEYFQLAVNGEEAAVVRQIYRWYTEEGWGTSRIAAALNRQGLRTKRGCTWTQTAVCRILTNRLYAGQVVNGRQEVADFLTGRRREKDETEWLVTERPDLRIVAPETFARAGAILAERGQAFRKDRVRQSSRHLLSSLIKCKACGASFRRMVRTYRNTYVRWVCAARNGKGAAACCNAAAVDEEELLAALQEHLTALLRRGGLGLPEAFRAFRRELRRAGGDGAKERELDARRSRLRRSREKYLELYAGDLLSRRELEEQLRRTERELEILEAEVSRAAACRAGGAQLDAVLGNLFPTLEDLADVRTLTNAQLRRIVQRMEVAPDGAVDIYLQPLEGRQAVPNRIDRT